MTTDDGRRTKRVCVDRGGRWRTESGRGRGRGMAFKSWSHPRIAGIPGSWYVVRVLLEWLTVWRSSGYISALKICTVTHPLSDICLASHLPSMFLNIHTTIHSYVYVDCLQLVVVVGVAWSISMPCTCARHMASPLGLVMDLVNVSIDMDMDVDVNVESWRGSKS